VTEKLVRAKHAVESTLNKADHYREYDFQENSLWWTNKVHYADGMVANVNIKVRFFRPEEKKRLA